MTRYVKQLTGDDRGAVALLVALAMVVLLGFAAVAIDATGMGFNERRQVQSAADVGALAAVQFAKPVSVGNPECAGLSGLSLSRCNGAVEARTVANATLDDSSLADWADASLCATPPAGYTTVPTVSSCIAFNANNQRAWVRIPTIEAPTTLARVIGFDSVAVTADAIAGTEFAARGGVLPFMMTAGAASASYNCLKSGPNPQFGPCSLLFPEVGNFGWADFFMYGDVTLGWGTECTGATQGRLVANVARGTDHPIGLHPTGSGTGIEEQPSCPDFNAEPNMLNSQTGNGSALEQGMLYGDNYLSPTPYPGRIEDSGGYLVRNGGGSNSPAVVDDTPLWTYLDNTAIGGTPCVGTDTPQEMVDCITWARSTSTVIFNDDLADAQRFGWVPEVWETDFTAPPPYHIKQFRPVYLDTVLFSCDANGCDIMYTPGAPDNGACFDDPPDWRITCGTPGPHQKTLDAVTAYVLAPEIVPDNAKTPQPGGLNQRTFSLVE